MAQDQSAQRVGHHSDQMPEQQQTRFDCVLQSIRRRLLFELRVDIAERASSVCVNLA